jgi:hypothetical protein
MERGPNAGREENLIDQITEAGNWLESQLKEMGVPEDTIETRCNLFGQLVAIMRLSDKGKDETPMKVAEKYLETLKKQNK